MRPRLLAALAVIVCTGCGVLNNPGAPDQSFSESDDITALEKSFGQATSIEEYYKSPESVTTRNRFIAGRLTLINLQYVKFIRNFSVSKSQWDSTLDLLATGVGLATTVVGGEGVKAALGAASAGIGATRTSIDKNFFYEKTVPVLITAMNAQRKQALIPILKGTEADIARYPLADALSDLSEYYFAGTFVGALQAIQKDAGVKEEEADIEIERLADFLDPARGTRIDALAAKVDALNKDDAIALATNPPVKDEKAMQLVNRMDPNNRRASSGGAARKVLRAMLQMDPRTDESLSAWEAALP